MAIKLANMITEIRKSLRIGVFIKPSSFRDADRGRRSRSPLLVGAIADEQQQRQGAEIRHAGAAAVADEWQGDSGKRDEFHDAAEDDEGLQDKRRAKPRRQQLGKTVVGFDRDPEN